LPEFWMPSKQKRGMKKLRNIFDIDKVDK